MIMLFQRKCILLLYTYAKQIILRLRKLIWWTVTLRLTHEMRRWRADQHLGLFATRYNFDLEMLRGSDNFRIEAAAGFDGQVKVLRLTEVGRFGNIVLQLLHAITLARHLGVRKVEIFPFNGGPAEGLYDIDDIIVEVAIKEKTTQPTLIGPFCHSVNFGTVLCADLLTGSNDIIVNIMRPLFAHLIEPVLEAPVDQLIINLRGGDIFEGPFIYAWYVQPPASFYVLAAINARQMFGIRRVTLVAQDRLNPALLVTMHKLSQKGFDVTVHCEGFAADLQQIMQARHLVAPFGTFCEAIAMLSINLRSYTAFRQFESHRHEHLGRECLLLHVLREHGVLPILIKDVEMDYIPPLHWNRTASQMAMMRDFPCDRLAVDLPQDNTDNFCVAKFGENVPPHIQPNVQS